MDNHETEKIGDIVPNSEAIKVAGPKFKKQILPHAIIRNTRILTLFVTFTNHGVFDQHRSSLLS